MTSVACMDGKTTEAMVTGDFVLFQDEMNPVMSALFENGVGVTALDNHFFFDETKVFFMHIRGEGAFSPLAIGVKQALAQQKTIRTANSTPVRTIVVF